MKTISIPSFGFAFLTLPLVAFSQFQPSGQPATPPVATPVASAPATAVPAGVVPDGLFEPLPILNASAILRPTYLQGPNFTVRNPVPTTAGANRYTIDSDFGVFEAKGNLLLTRRIAEIKALAQLQTMSQSKEFTDALKQAATVPLNVAQNLVTDPVATIASVPKGIVGLINRTGQSIKEATQNRQAAPEQGNVVSNVSGFAKTKRNLAIQLGVDPYTTNPVFQQELSKVAWPAFLGKFTVNLGMAAVSGGVGTALSATNLSSSLNDALRDKSPADLRLMNLGKLLGMGVSREDANNFLNNNALTPSTQTVLVGALTQLGNISGQAEFIRQATTSQDEYEGLSFQQAAELIAKLNKASSVSSIKHLGGLTVCQTKDGTVVVPIQWDYVAWTAGTSQFVTALKAATFPKPATAYSAMITGVASPMATDALTKLGVSLQQKSLPGPLQ